MHDVWTIRGIPLKVEVTKTVKVNLYIHRKKTYLCSTYAQNVIKKSFH